jgi:hypothetical protein
VPRPFFPNTPLAWRIVDHHDAAGFLGQLAQAGQRPEVAVHAEHAVGDEELALSGRQVLDDLPRRVDVLVREHLDRRAAETAAVDDARVIELVGDDDVLFAENRRDRARRSPRKPLWKTTTFSTFLNSASFFSSSMWMSMVPAIVRTEPVPTP